MTRKHLLLGLAVSVLAAAGCKLASTSETTTGESSAATGSGVKLTQLDDRVRVEIGGQLFTEYIFKNTPRPYCYPVIGPGGVPITRNFPMKDVEGEDKDHKHHRSLWYAHGEINGVDFWSEDRAFGKTVHDKFLEVKSGGKFGVIRSLNNWVSADGKLVCTDERTIRFHADRTIDFDLTFKKADGELVFGDTKEGSMSLRLNEDMRLKANKSGHGKGHIVMSSGVRDDKMEPKQRETKTWGTRAEWVDYYSPVDGKTVGVAMFDHPSNPRHPTYWHVRDYGLFSANPFGIHDFERLGKDNAHKGDLKVPAGQPVTFRYRIYFHEGDEVQGKVAEHYKAYVAETKGR
jgi:hypothetical protein